MAELYRKSALERISSPEQLDKALKITSPISWLALLGITAAIVVTVIWSIFGTLPETITANAIIVSPVSTNAVYIHETGEVVSVNVRVGDEIGVGTPILTYKTSSNEIRSLLSDQFGYVENIMLKKGDTFVQGNEVIRISPKVSGSQVVVCYAPLAQSKKLERAMRVYVYLNGIDSQSHGHMEARIINIDSYAASTESMRYVLGGGNNLDSAFLSNGAVVAVTCELYPSKETASGYYWSNEKGSTVTVSNGSLASAKIVTEEVAPITKLFSKLKEIWGE